MPVELSELMQLAIGHRPNLQVGELPRSIAERMSANPGLVFLGHNEIHKIAKKHKEIKREEFQILPFLFRHGRYYFDANRPECMTVFYAYRENGKTYVCGIKSADKGGEVWVQTYYRISEKKAHKKISRLVLVHPI